jgi:hypothetical protein
MQCSLEIHRTAYFILRYLSAIPARSSIILYAPETKAYAMLSMGLEKFCNNEVH